MALCGWSWEAALGPAGLGDRPLLEALAAAIPDETVVATARFLGTIASASRRSISSSVISEARGRSSEPAISA